MLPMRSTGGGVVTEAMLYAFDLLERDGEMFDLTISPLAKRKARLAKLVGRSDRGIVYNGHTDEGGATVAARVQARTRGHRVEAALEAVSVRPVWALAEGQEPGEPGDGESASRNVVRRSTDWSTL